MNFYELIFQKSAKYMNVSIEKVLEESLVDYVKIIRQKKRLSIKRA
jgi:hypothetical protein